MHFYFKRRGKFLAFGPLEGKVNTNISFQHTLSPYEINFPSSCSTLQRTDQRVGYLGGVVSNHSFNLGVQNNDGSCKAYDDYVADFKSVPMTTNRNFKIFSLSSATCNVINPILQAAKDTNGKVVAGIWPSATTPDPALDSQLADLMTAIGSYGSDGIQDILVGSEVLYRRDYSAQILESKIAAVKQKLQNANLKLRVGIADTWDALIRPENDVATSAADVLYVNSFPYWQHQDINNATASFNDSITQVRKYFGANKAITIGETGWPTAGGNYGAGVPSVANAKTYYQDVYCALQKNGMDGWYFELTDEDWKPDTNGVNVERHWGVMNSGHSDKWNLTCP